MGTSLRLDAHAAPPIGIRHEYKKYQKLRPRDFNEDLDIIDFRRGLTRSQDADIVQIGAVSAERIAAVCRSFHQTDKQHIPITENTVSPNSIPIYQHRDLPGLHVLPALLPPKTQLYLLSRLLHHELSNPEHNTNIHAHYQVPYFLDAPFPTSEAQNAYNITSFFSRSPSSSNLFSPKDSATHRPLSISQFLQRKLRWMTLGGQYDWTKKEYPLGPPPPFPVDIAELLHGLFPEIKPQAAIVNLYSPGDTLSMHRDVSEECDKGLISVSLGCDCIFMVGLEENKEDQIDDEDIRQQFSGGGRHDKNARVLALRLRSGDVVCMSGKSRFAWHGVPRIIPGTCPEWMQEWPARSLPEKEVGVNGSYGSSGEFEAWRGWMASKRINLNVRQMWE
ncbi:hypothetical protein FGG08_000718 [Glutinoglossum americanum]|uniref:mRNA N(6)-methyladenine demethylase n=1 Tax=Glutinoglossum americanum TaxID=1670608 RepID=A0A9P8L5Y4_9PEZI|nr:hypothetical protein FGG08_000718 [Glutinoglossum americanum]